MTKLNIATLAAASTGFIHFVGYDKEPLYADDAQALPIGVRVHGPGSKAGRSVRAAQTNFYLERQAATAAKKKAASLTAEELDEQQVDRLTKRTIEFVNFEYRPEGFTGFGAVDAFRAFYSDPEMGMFHDQIVEKLDDWGNFAPSSATS